MLEEPSRNAKGNTHRYRHRHTDRHTHTHRHTHTQTDREVDGGCWDLVASGEFDRAKAACNGVSANVCDGEAEEDTFAILHGKLVVEPAIVWCCEE